MFISEPSIQSVLIAFRAEVDDVTTRTMQMRIFRTQSRANFRQGKGYNDLPIVSCFIRLYSPSRIEEVFKKSACKGNYAGKHNQRIVFVLKAFGIWMTVYRQLPIKTFDCNGCLVLHKGFLILLFKYYTGVFSVKINVMLECTVHVAPSPFCKESAYRNSHGYHDMSRCQISWSTPVDQRGRTLRWLDSNSCR